MQTTPAHIPGIKPMTAEKPFRQILKQAADHVAHDRNAAIQLLAAVADPDRRDEFIDDVRFRECIAKYACLGLITSLQAADGLVSVKQSATTNSQN